MAKFVNTDSLSSLSLEKEMAAKLKDLLREISWLHGWQIEGADIQESEASFDFRVMLPLPNGGAAELLVLCKTELRPGYFPAIAGKFSNVRRSLENVFPVLALPWVSPRMAEMCARYGWGWLDGAGNYRLEIPEVLRIERTGIKAAFKRPRPSANLGTPEAARVVRSLLLPDWAGQRRTQREVRLHCQPGVSIGLVNKVVQYLRDEAFLEMAEDGGGYLREPQKLLFAWRDVYRFERHKRLGYFSLMQGEKLRDALAQLDLHSGGRAAYAAFSAADFQAPHVRQPKSWLYVSEEWLTLFEKLADAKRVDSGENIVVMVPEDEGVFYQGEQCMPDMMQCTNVVQTYVDLWHTGGRGQEAADALLRQKLTPVWKLRGLNT